MPEYTCYRCRIYKTPKKSNMYLHLCKTTKCKIDKNSLAPTIDEHIKNSVIIEEDWNFFKNNNNYNCIKTSNEFIDELKEIYFSKRIKCNHCNITFNKYKELENHLFSCIKIENNTNTTNNNITNTTNNITTNNTTINNNINLNINGEPINKDNIFIVSFDKDWTTSHINPETKIHLFLTRFNKRYTKTLEAIMENNINKNVLIDKESNSGLVCNNNNLERMKIKDIVDECIIKIQKHLVEFGQGMMDDNDINIEFIKSILRDNRYELHNYNNSKTHEIELDKLITSSLDKYSEKTKECIINLQEKQLLK